MFPPRYRSKTLATWLAVLAGPLGVHRAYLYGGRDLLAWLHLLPTLAGLLGAWRMRELGQDDRLAWVLLPVLGLMIAQAMLTAIVWGLTADDKWDRLHNGGRSGPASGWPVVLAVIVALLVGATALMSTAAFGGQRFFEWQLEAARR